MNTGDQSTIETTVIGVFGGHAEARQALDALRQAGFTDARWYEGELNRGRAIVSVRAPEGRADDARNVIRTVGGEVHEAAGIGSYGTGLMATPY